ncbi:Cytochrome p450 [Phytophthora palmivora]|uniref:Cytochrome p450 n=1 Tax=Phytophthora palmivora TaxID=4796 RepID=A0A2P4YAI1_9STRA|nr:Cytochrome p450 [Phytophthora palmivora]
MVLPTRSIVTILRLENRLPEYVVDISRYSWAVNREYYGGVTAGSLPFNEHGMLPWESLRITWDEDDGSDDNRINPWFKEQFTHRPKMWTFVQHASSQLNAVIAGTALVIFCWKALSHSLRSPEQIAADESFQRIHRPKSTLPVLGNTLDAMFFQTERFVDWMAEQSIIAGGRPWLMHIIGQPPTFVITSPESYEDLFKTQRHIFERGATMSYIFKDFLGEGIIAVDGHKWSQQRKTASHLFTNRMMREVMSEEVRNKCIKLRELLDLCAEDGKTVSMKSLISKFTSDVFTKIGFGVELHGLDASRLDLSQEHPFIQAIDDMSRLLQLRCQQPMFLWRLKRWLNVAEEREGKQNMMIIASIDNDVMMH